MLVGLAAIAVAGCSPAHTASPDRPADAPSLTAVTIKSGDTAHKFRVEIARTAAEQERGLMYRTSLPADGGMLFPFDPPERAAFWMKNTYIPLDMVFIRADGTIARIAANTTPYSLEPVDAGEPIAAVLEINGGAAQAAGIKPGDVALWTIGRP